MQEEVSCIVKVADIVELPTKLGSRCALLRTIGLDCYHNTEEELFDALTESAKCPEKLKICLEDSRCQAFWEKFQQGHTPFIDRDPVRLFEYGGKYWVVEGKHRACLAKRAGVETLEAIVHHLDEDTMTVLPSLGQPGHFSFCYSQVADFRSKKQISGNMAFLCVDHPDVTAKLFFGLIRLDDSQDTEGEWREIIPGICFRISVEEKRQGLLFFKRKSLKVQSEVTISPGHLKTKIWLLQLSMPVKMPQAPIEELSPFQTVYRFGRWRRGHLRWLAHILRLQVV